MRETRTVDRTQPIGEITDATPRFGARWWPHDSVLRWTERPQLPVRERGDHRRQLRGLDLLRAAAPEPVDRTRVVLSLHRERLLPRPRVVDRELAHRDVPARELGPHP